MIRDAVRSWVSDRVIPKIDEAFRDHFFPQEWIPEMAELGLFGPTLPEEYGAGIGDIAYGLAMQERRVA